MNEGENLKKDDILFGWRIIKYLLSQLYHFYS